MPEHIDPIRALEAFHGGTLREAPLEPGEVRRLGDRRRTRRTMSIAVVSAAVVIAAVVPATLIATRDSSNGSHPVGPAGTPTATATSGAPQVITYPEPGIQVIEQPDTAKLNGTTSDFKAFIGNLANEQAAAGASCPDAFHGVTVQKYSSAGYAFGGVNACGGNVALWAERDTGWQEVAGGQEAFDCDELRYYDIPESFVGGCYDYKGDFGPTQANGLRLGMNAHQAVAAGGTIQDGSADECRAVVPADLSPDPNRTDAFLSPTKGIVGIGARPGMKTPEGIGLGSTKADVKAAYPNGVLSQNGYWVVPLSATTEYEIGLEADGTVGEIMLATTDQDCFG